MGDLQGRLLIWAWACATDESRLTWAIFRHHEADARHVALDGQMGQQPGRGSRGHVRLIDSEAGAAPDAVQVWAALHSRIHCGGDGGGQWLRTQAAKTGPVPRMTERPSPRLQSMRTDVVGSATDSRMKVASWPKPRMGNVPHPDSKKGGPNCLFTMALYPTSTARYVADRTLSAVCE